MKINFLSIKESRELFKKPDSYVQSLPLINLMMVNPRNPTIEGYQEVFLNSFDSFSEEEISNILKIKERYLKNLDLEINLVKTKGSHPLDITQTRNNSILVTGGFMGPSLFVHEVFHILSRKYPEITPKLASIWGFKQINPQDINHQEFLLNPDAEISNYSKVVIHSKTNKEIEVTPFVSYMLKTGLKVSNKNEYIKEKDTNYGDSISNTTYIAHPEEICAEHFAIIITGSCIYSKKPLDLNSLDKFKSMLFEELAKANLKI